MGRVADVALLATAYARGHLVADRPGEDRRMVLIAGHGAAQHLECLRADRGLRGDGVRHLVDRNLVPDEDAVAVGLLQEPWVKRVVRACEGGAEALELAP